MAGFFASFPSSSGGVTSVNSLTGALTLAAGSGITITPSGNTLTISATGTGGIASINADITAAQTLTVGTSGTDFAIVDGGGGSHVFNLPDASATSRGALTSADWTTFNNAASNSANVALSNLVSTSVNADLVPSGSGKNLGSLATTWDNLYASNINGGTYYGATGGNDSNALFGSPLGIYPDSVDPVTVTPIAGELYYNTTSDVLRFYNGSVWGDVASSSEGANVNLTSPQSIGTGTPLVFNAGEYVFDTGNFSSTDSQFTVSKAGIYTISSFSVFNTPNTYAFIEYSINGAANIEFAFGYAPTGVNPRVIGTAVLNLAANDVITFFGTRGASGSLFTNLFISGS